MANRTKLTPDVEARICQAIQLGATYELACLYGGVAYESFRRWRHTKRAFCAAVEKAEGQAVVGWLATIEKAARDGEWTAAAWKLERRYPDVYGRRVQEVRGSPDAPVVFTLKIGEREPAALAPPTPLRALEAEDG